MPEEPIESSVAPRPSARAILELGVAGLHLPTPPSAPPLPLGAGEVRLLAALGGDEYPSLSAAVEAIEATTPCVTDELRRFADRSLRRGWLTNNVAAQAPLRPSGEPASPGGPIDDSALVGIPTPTSLVPSGDRFLMFDHGGELIASLGWVETLALASLTVPTNVADAHALHRRHAGAHALTEVAFTALLERLLGSGVAAVVAPDDPHFVEVTSDAATLARIERERICDEVFARQAEEDLAAERRREAETGQTRTMVVPVAFDPTPPLGLGLIAAYAQVHDGGSLNDTYVFRREWVWSDDRIPEYTERPSVFMFSNYLWSHEHCIDVSRRVKEVSPASITIHGGPDTPKYDLDAKAYFLEHPHVDITVRGEGEAAAAEVLAALASVIGDDDPDLSVLADVPGIYYRDGATCAKTAERERISDLDIIPSPFLTGLFDAYKEIPNTNVTIETNRGCPYGCTFCDWGSATLSRIRKYDLERVFAELDWCAESHIWGVGPADSNFGIFKRDVEIAERIADLKRRHQFPKVFGVSYAKNTVKHLAHIIQTMADAGIVSQGILSLQTMDDDVLDAVHRANIRTDKYDALAAEMRRAKLPLFVDLMLGLPGSSRESFTSDLQQCVDREVQVRIPRTTLLVNSPMNDPEYRAEYAIETNMPLGPGRTPLVVESTTFTRDDYAQMSVQRRNFLLFENFGVLRQVSRYVRHETGTPEAHFYEGLRLAADADPTRWPLLHVLTTITPDSMAEPGSWQLVIDELRTYLTDVVGVQDDSALDTVLTVQHALLPSHHRDVPTTLHLAHDWGEWYRRMLATKESGAEARGRWTELVPALRDLAPAPFPVDDPGQVARRSLGCDLEMHGFGLNWEFQSPVARAFLATDKTVETVGAF